jgi:serine/threonine protein kinase
MHFHYPPQIDNRYSGRRRRRARRDFIKLRNSHALLVSKLLVDVASALKALHEMAYLHLDVKPSNILLRHGGDIRDGGVLADFGSAIPISDTIPTAKSYTPEYSAPEVIISSGKRAKQQIQSSSSSSSYDMCHQHNSIGVGSDSWGYAVTAYMALTFRHPYIDTDKLNRRDERLALIMHLFRNFDSILIPEIHRNLSNGCSKLGVLLRQTLTSMDSSCRPSMYAFIEAN